MKNPMTTWLAAAAVAAGGAQGGVCVDRYPCNTCHVPQVDAKPLMENRFVGTPVPPRKQP